MSRNMHLFSIGVFQVDITSPHYSTNVLGDVPKVQTQNRKSHSQSLIMLKPLLIQIFSGILAAQYAPTEKLKKAWHNGDMWNYVISYTKLNEVV